MTDDPVPTAAAPADELPEEVVLGVDYGTVRIGLALGYVRTGLTLGLPVLDNPGSEEGVVERLAEVARARGVSVVVIGDPKHMSGAVSSGSRTSARLAEGLRRALDVLVVLEDERLTSADAEAQMRDVGLRWWQVPRGKIDTVAAMGIVRAYLTKRNPALLLATEEEAAPPPEREAGRERRDRRKRAQRRSRKRGDAAESEEEA